MTFRVDFWVAAATVAPVIALSATVAISDNFRQLAGLEISLAPHSPSEATGRKVGLSAYLISSANIAVQSLVLIFALLALMQDDNVISPFLVAFGEFFGLIFIFVSIILNARMGLAVSRAPEDQRRKSGNGRSEISSAIQEPLQQDSERENHDDGDEAP